MTVTFDLSPDKEKKLLDRAAANGQDVPGYIREIIEKDLQRANKLSKILAPVRQEFVDSGMTEDELDTLLDECRDEVWREKQAGKAT